MSEKIVQVPLEKTSFDTLSRLARAERRSMGRQAAVIVEEYMNVRAGSRADRLALANAAAERKPDADTLQPQ